jgi:hypothetical protein
MIQNEREYRITSAWLKRFERDVETLEHNPAKPGAPGPQGAAVGARSDPSPSGAAVGSRGTHPKLHKAKSTRAAVRPKICGRNWRRSMRCGHIKSRA